MTGVFGSIGVCPHCTNRNAIDRKNNDIPSDSSSVNKPYANDINGGKFCNPINKVTPLFDMDEKVSKTKKSGLITQLKEMYPEKSYTYMGAGSNVTIIRKSDGKQMQVITNDNIVKIKFPAAYTLELHYEGKKLGQSFGYIGDKQVLWKYFQEDGQVAGFEEFDKTGSTSIHSVTMDEYGNKTFEKFLNQDNTSTAIFFNNGEVEKKILDKDGRILTPPTVKDIKEGIHI